MYAYIVMCIGICYVYTLMYEVHAHIQTRMCMFVCLHTLLYMSMCMHMHMQMCVCIYVYMHVCIYALHTCMYSFIYTPSIYAYLQKYIHTYIHTYKYTKQK
jgi:hypothetical protein